MAKPGELDPPVDIRKEDDPGARQLDQSDSEDHFTDAQSAASAHGESPVPVTRVERVDNEPAHGEVPGTEAHEMRASDAKPDEIAVIREDESDSEPGAAMRSDEVPVTMVEEAPGSMGPRSQEFVDKRQADATPDVVVSPEGDEKAEASGESNTDEPNSPSLQASQPFTEPAHQPERELSTQISPDSDNGSGFGEDADDAFGDDFDDFEEGAGDDDFDDFEDGFQQSEPQAQPAPIPAQATLPFAIPDFDGLSPEEILSSTESHLAYLFPPEGLNVPEFPPLPKESTSFTTPRSASLWSQLIAPPPLAPPDWIRSRTRRLFLVSLGVPVDLDEILPASKQKKLVLPSLNVPSGASPRTSSDSRSVSRLRQGEANASSTSVDTQGKPRRRKGPPPPPDFDMVSARHACKTTDEALDGMTDPELQSHVTKLQGLEVTAKEVLEYWTKRTDERIAERETFEGVIENLVKHARKVRK